MTSQYAPPTSPPAPAAGRVRLITARRRSGVIASPGALAEGDIGRGDIDDPAREKADNVHNVEQQPHEKPTPPRGGEEATRPGHRDTVGRRAECLVDAR